MGQLTRRLARPSTPALVLGAALWAWAAHALWAATSLPSLDLPHLDPHDFFTDSFLERSATFERFLAIEGVLAWVAVLAVLAVYAKRGPQLVRESAAGRVGTGMLLAMLGFAVVWLTQVPFDLLSLWWERRYDVSHQGYVQHLLFSFLGLGGQFVFVCVGFGIAMGLAGVMRRWWWLAVVPAFMALAVLFAFLTPYLVPDTSAIERPALKAEARALERIEGSREARLRVQDVDSFTDAPNAMTVGLGPSSTVIFWDTLLNGDFSRNEVRFVLAHEIGHLAHDDTVKRLGWLTLFLLPAWGLTALLTRRRGGLARPEAIPLALLVLVAIQFLATPILNVAYRREEAAADWAALQATREPATGKAVMRQLATKSLSNPDPAAWISALYENHPPIMRRIEMAAAWESTSHSAGR
ncbi:MAG TPA: M48 family metalloprotease [Solirubrobacterales bacterium]|nr:M48 family metalloprotease [Solirubrobacterales bacterium]